MNFKEFLNESIISDIQKEEKIFLLIIGGSASGKNYFFERNFKMKLVDVDKILKDLDSSQDRTFLSKAIAKANEELDKSFREGISVAQVSTGAGTTGVKNKLKKAEQFGFKTGLILVDTDPKVAIKRNKERANSGSQKLIPDWKIEKTNKEARETFNELKSSVNFSTKVRN